MEEQISGVDAAAGAAAPSLEKRPHSRDVEVNGVVERLLPEVLDWLTGSQDADQIARDLRQALDSAFSWDGYEVAKQLDRRHYWSCDFQLCKILDNARWYRNDAHDALVAAWVERNAIMPAFAVGDSVVITQGRVTYAGEITSIDAKHAKYTVFISAFEDVKPAPQGGE
jgi:hypothetical protein